MKILYLGDGHPRSTSRHRSNALIRIGHEVEHQNPHNSIPPWHWLARINVRTGYRIFSHWIHRKMVRRLTNSRWDLAWIDGGAELPPAFYRWLRERGKPVVNYVTDNPFVRRDYRKWDQYKQCLPFHDLTIFPREENLVPGLSAGARRVLRVYFSYDPVAHHPDLAKGVSPGSQAEVRFIGSWMPERGAVWPAFGERGYP